MSILGKPRQEREGIENSWAIRVLRLINDTKEMMVPLRREGFKPYITSKEQSTQVNEFNMPGSKCSQTLLF